MQPIAVLTDATVLFPSPVFEGREHVTILPAKWQPAPLKDKTDNLKAADLPASLTDAAAPRFQAPGADEFERAFRALGKGRSVLAVLHSSELSDTYQNAQAVANELQGKVSVRVVDSSTVSLGLGFMVQAAAQAADRLELVDLDLYVRSFLPRVYTQFCIPSLSYLEGSGYVNRSQALVAEYLGMLPLFTLENGELVATEKARNLRHLVDVMQEFLMEFQDLEHIAILQGAPPFEQETRALRERLAEDHPNSPISEQIINTPLASLIGPRSLGIFALQRDS